MEKLVIIWLGGAGYTAGIYAFRYNLNPILIGQMDGWLITECHMVENFPGYPKAVTGYEIMSDMRKQIENYPVRIYQDTVKSVLPIDSNDFSKGYKIETDFKWIIETKSVLLATGTKKIRLWVEWERHFFGKWVSYCATCDGFFYRWKTVLVAGGWDSAFIEALYLSDICEKVYVVHRRNKFRGQPFWENKLRSKTNVEIVTPSVIKQIWWDQKVWFVELSIWKNAQTYNEATEFEDRKIDVDGVFIAVWTKANPVNWLDEYLKRNEEWYILVNEHMATNLEWVFASGDCTTWSWGFRQLITACAEWAIAWESIFTYLSGQD